MKEIPEADYQEFLDHCRVAKNEYSRASFADEPGDC